MALIPWDIDPLAKCPENSDVGLCLPRNLGFAGTREGRKIPLIKACFAKRVGGSLSNKMWV